MKILTPKEITESTLQIGQNKVAASENYPRLLLLAVLAGCYIALGGVLATITGYGFPDLTAGNPALQRIVSGCMFPIGLVLVVVLGAELFTGNNALLIPGFMNRRFTALDVAKNWTIVYAGNFAGAVGFSWLMVYMAGLTAAEPYHSAIIGIAEAKVSMPWVTVLIKGIGANWCVCLAVWLALSGHTLIEKMAGCWLPVMAFVALGYEHSIANMYYIPTGMMEGASVTAIQFVVNNLIPATIGNIIGGAVFVGCVHAYLHLKKTK